MHPSKLAKPHRKNLSRKVLPLEKPPQPPSRPLARSGSASYLFLWVLVGIVLLTGLVFPDLMGADAPQDAGMAMRMHQQNDYVNLLRRSGDYLDKPHLLFWSAALGYKLFGVHDWSYRLCSVLVCLLGAYATYQLGRLLYGRSAGRIAALIFVTAQGILLGNHDVRMDALLTGFTAVGIWQFVLYVRTRQLACMVGGAVALGLGMATKGAISVVVAGCCVFFYMLGLRRLRMVWHWHWLAGLAVFMITLSPVLYSYYLQFDLHPEKLVHGQQGVSGVKFILWQQGLERFSGQNGAHARVQSPEFFYFHHSFLWAFLPWSLLTLAALTNRIGRWLRNGWRAFFTQEQLTFVGVLVFFHALSLSQFKLPHYLNVLFPMFAVFTAGYVDELHRRTQTIVLRRLYAAQTVLVVLILLTAGLVNGYLFPVQSAWVGLGLLGFGGALLAYLRRPSLLERVWMPSAVAILLFNFALNTSFYVQIAHYQVGAATVRQINQHDVNWAHVYMFERWYLPFDFYARRFPSLLSTAQIQEKRTRSEPVYVVTNEAGKQRLTAEGISAAEVFRTPDYHLTKLKINFLDPRTRAESYGYAYLLRID